LTRERKWIILDSMNDYTEEDLIERWEEIAAIREYDGHMPRKIAERAAYFDLRRELGPHVHIPERITNELRRR